MKTSIWGPSAWRFLHAISFAYPEKPTREHKDAVRSLLLSLRSLLPCEWCQKHFMEEMEHTNFETIIESRDALSKWLVDFHNKVNVRLGKSLYDYSKAKHEFEIDEGECTVTIGCDDSAQNAPHQSHSHSASAGKVAEQPVSGKSSAPKASSTRFVMVLMISILFTMVTGVLLFKWLQANKLKVQVK